MPEKPDQAISSSHIASSLAIILSLIAIISNSVTLYASINSFSSDREEKTQRRNFDIIKLYFDDLTKQGDFCSNRENITLFVAAANSYAKDIYAVMAGDLNNRVKVCPGLAAANSDAGASSTPNPQTSYAVQNKLPGSTPSNETGSDVLLSDLTVYIQYNDASKTMEQILPTLRSAVKNLPSPEKVSAVPKSNQIRIFKNNQAQAAGKLSSELESVTHLHFDIVNLQKTYPNLPNGNIELWLADSAP